jgi:3-dehydroquinate dehydratase II
LPFLLNFWLLSRTFSTRQRWTHREMARILLLNGPNLNLLGLREPEIYGSTTLPDIENKLINLARGRGHDLVASQSNAEHELIDEVHGAKREGFAFIIINPGAYTHTSIALRDAFLAVAIPFIEIHITNIFAREEFRHRSYLSGIAVGCIVGLGVLGYEFALEAACARLAAI